MGDDANFGNVEKNKVSIDLKTKIYKGLLKWSRENIQSHEPSEAGSSSNDLVNSKYYISHNFR